MKNGGYPSIDEIKQELCDEEDDDSMDIDEHQLSNNSMDSSLMDVEDSEPTPEFGPAALGLQRVGTKPPPKPNPPMQPVQVLNRRGMPARIRKKNKLFYDDILVNHPHHRLVFLFPITQRIIRFERKKILSGLVIFLNIGSSLSLLVGLVFKDSVKLTVSQRGLKVCTIKTHNRSHSPRIKKDPSIMEMKASPKKMARPSPGKKLQKPVAETKRQSSGVAASVPAALVTSTPPIKQEKEVEKQAAAAATTQLGSPDRKIGQKIGMRLRNLLKLPKAHKWVCYEWFYSNIDKTLFEGDNDFMICLKESFPQLQSRKLTRVEWCKIRRMMGKPRRCSQSFFEEERRELERKRQKIRMLQQRKAGDMSGFKDLPPEIPLQLVIGTKVTARLRKPQDGLFTGSIDAVDTSNNTYRITFERAGLGTHSVPDYEVLSNEPPETISVSSFALHFRPRHVAYVPAQPYALKVRSPRLNNDPLISNAAIPTPKRAHIGGTMNGYPLKLLEFIVKVNKILAAKKLKIQKLKEMNAEAEKHRSLGEYLPPDFERRYAG